MPVRSGMPARYHAPMDADRTVDRAAWAEIVAEILRAETKGKKEPLARLLGVNVRTITHWLNQTAGVSEASIRQVADRTNRSAIDLLVRVGFYRPDEVTTAARPAVDPDDEAQRLILESPFTPRVKARMLQRLEELRDRDRKREADEVRFWIEQFEESEPTRDRDEDPTPDRT